MSKLLEFVMSDNADFSCLSREQLEDCLLEIRTTQKDNVIASSVIRENIGLKEKVADLEVNRDFWMTEANNKHSSAERKSAESYAILFEEVKELRIDNESLRKRVYALEHPEEVAYF